MAKVFWVDKDAIAVGDLASDNKTVTGPTAGTLTIHASRHDFPFVKTDNGGTVSDGAGGNIRIETGIVESPTIPVEYHEALTYKAIAHGYEKKGNMKSAEYFHNKFTIACAEGKQESNSHKSEELGITIIGTEF